MNNIIKQNKLKLSFILVALSFITSSVWAQQIDSIIATVNNAVITKSELQNSISTVKKQISQNQMTEPSEGELNKQVLDQMINRKLQLQFAEQSGIKVTDEEVDHAINHIAQENKITASEIYEKVSLEGMSKADYRKNLKEELMLHKLQEQEVASKITINPQEVDDFMHTKAYQASSTKEYHLEDILVSIPDEPTSNQLTQAKEEANAILKKIRQGVSFDQAAASDSNHKGNSLQNGDLGWRKLPEIPSAFAQQVSHMKSNDVIGPIQAPNGFHIVHLAGIRNAEGQTNLAMQRNQAEQLIFQRKLEENLQTWIMKLRSGASINVNLQA